MYVYTATTHAAYLRLQTLHSAVAVTSLASSTRFVVDSSSARTVIPSCMANVCSQEFACESQPSRIRAYVAAFMRTRRGQGWLLRNIYPTLRRKLALYFRHGEMYAPCISSVRRIIRFTSMCESSHCFAQCKSVKGYRNSNKVISVPPVALMCCHCYK